MGKIVFVLLFFLPCINLFSQSNVTAHIYKKIDSISLDFKLYKPDSFNGNEKYSTVILFHGEDLIQGMKINLNLYLLINWPCCFVTIYGFFFK